MSLTDKAIFRTDTIRVGIFRCTPDDERFATAGQPTEHFLVVFPRTGVWIRNAGGRPFVADPGVATVYHVGQEYVRAPLCPDGDRSDWFGMTREAAMKLSHPSRPDDDTLRWRTRHVRVPPSLYAGQRQLLVDLQAGRVEGFEAEERALSIVATTLGAAAVRPASGTRHGTRTLEAHRDLAARARAELARDASQGTDVTTLAARLGVSPFHLCRVFRSQVGQPLHAYRLDLRLRLALERLEDRATSCSTLAHELGFSSHSHFTAAFRSRLGWTPARARALLSPGAPVPHGLRAPRRTRR